jgi:hypothetical protein
MADSVAPPDEPDRRLSLSTGLIHKTADEVELYDDVLGEGAFGIVKLGKDRETNTLMAIKQLDKAFLRREKKVEAVKREKEILTKLRSQPHIVHLFYTYQDADKLCMLALQHRDRQRQTQTDN